MQPLSQKDKAAINSSKLLRICTEKMYSWSTIERISEKLQPLRKNGDQHDRMVIKILDIVQNSNTEAEVLEKLKTL